MLSCLLMLATIAGCESAILCLSLGSLRNVLLSEQGAQAREAALNSRLQVEQARASQPALPSGTWVSLGVYHHVGLASISSLNCSFQIRLTSVTGKNSRRVPFPPEIFGQTLMPSTVVLTPR